MFEFLAQNAQAYPTRLALKGLRKRSRTSMTYAQYAVAVMKTAEVLRKLSLPPRSRLLNLSGNRPEWVVLDLAAQLADLIPCAMPAFVSEHNLQDFVRITEPDSAFVEDEGLAAKAAECGIKKIISYEDPLLQEAFEPSDAGLSLAIEELRRAGKGTNDDKTAYLTTSSGTTGGIKACRISFGNARLYGPVIGKLMGLTGQDSNFSFLPLSQTRMQDHYLFLANAGTVYHSGFDEDIYGQLLTEARPTFIASAPFFFSEIKDRFQKVDDRSGPRQLSDHLGGATHLYTGTTPVDPRLIEFYREHGCSLLEGYGMTECSSMATMNTPGREKSGTQGYVVPGVRVALAEDGEVLVAGPNVSPGYWNNETADRATFSGGWLHTGDLGRFDGDGALVLEGRKKEIVILSNGKKLFPERYERGFRGIPEISFAMLAGSGKENPGILLDLKEGCVVTGELERKIREMVEVINGPLPSDEKIGRWLFLDPPLSIERGEITTSFKLKRHVIEKNRARLIEDLYGEKNG